MEHNMNHELTYQTALAEFKGKVRILALIWTFWFGFLWLFSLGSDPSLWRLAKDAHTAALAFYLPYRVSHSLTGTPVGGAVGALVISLWISTWIGNHPVLAWLLIVGGYAVDFGPCCYRLLISWRR